MYISRSCHLSIFFITFHTVLGEFLVAECHQKGTKQRKRPATASADGPSSQRSRRSSTINFTMAMRSDNQPPSAPTASVPPASRLLFLLRMFLPVVELLQMLMSIVTAEVTKQLSTQATQLSTMLPTPVPVASTDQPVPTYMQEPSSSHNFPAPQGQQSEANTLVTGAITGAHASISGA